MGIKGRHIADAEDGVFQAGHYGWYYRIKGMIEGPFDTYDLAYSAYVNKKGF